jgi:hypothetical protein
MRPRLLVPIAAVLLVVVRMTAQGDCHGADLIVRNGRILTMDDAGTIARAMAIGGDRILAVGSNAEIAACAGDSPTDRQGTVPRIIDLGGQTVLPGLIDVHTHAQEWAKGLIKGEINLGYPNVRSVDEIVSTVAERARRSRPGEWIVGFGWDDAKLTDRRYVTRQDLDGVSAHNPVYLVHVSGHLGVANGAALKLAGITAQMPDPPGGVIEKNSAGDTTGIVKDAAMALVAQELPPDPKDIARQAARLATQKAAEVGLTTIHDIWISPDDRRGYQQAHERAELSVRVHMAPGVRNLADAEQLVKMGVHTGFGDRHLELGGVKMFADGGMGARTIAIYQPGVTGEPENVGLLLWKSEDMRKAHTMLASAGWQLITHAIGDRAIDQVLDSYAETVQTLELKDPRFRIAHAGVSTPTVQRRLRDLRVMVDGNPPFVYWIGSWFRKYGPDRVRWSYPGKSYVAHGIVAGGASDVGVTPIAPWWGIWAAVLRQEMESGEVLAPDERLTLREALTLYTRNGAYIGKEEDEKGSLERGKLADFIIVDRDVFAIPHGQLKDVQVRATYVGGKVVYRADGSH